MNQFLSMMFNNMLTSENIATYVEPLSFKSERTVEDIFNIILESNDPEEMAKFAFVKEIVQFILERSSYTIKGIQKVNNYEYLVQVSFRLLLSSNFSFRMSEYIIKDYVDSLGTEEDITKIQSKEEESKFFIQLIEERVKEFQKLPLKTTDFINNTYTFRVTKVSEKDKFRIVFASREDIDDFYEVFCN